MIYNNYNNSYYYMSDKKEYYKNYYIKNKVNLKIMNKTAEKRAYFHEYYINNKKQTLNINAFCVRITTDKPSCIIYI